MHLWISGPNAPPALRINLYGSWLRVLSGDL